MFSAFRRTRHQSRVKARRVWPGLRGSPQDKSHGLSADPSDKQEEQRDSFSYRTDHGLVGFSDPRFCISKSLSITSGYRFLKLGLDGAISV